MGAPQRGLRTSSFKLIQFPNGELPDELYAVDADPKEQRDLAGEEPERLAEARELLELSWSRLAAGAAEARPVEIDEETRRRLEALGYVQ